MVIRVFARKPPVFVKGSDDEAGSALPAYLIGERMSEFERVVHCRASRLRSSSERLSLSEYGNLYLTANSPVSSIRARSKMNTMRIDEASHQNAARSQDAVRLAPHRKNAFREEVGYGVKHKVEAGVLKYREVCHVALDGMDIQPVSLCYEFVLGKLSRRVVVRSDVKSSRGD